MSAGIHLTINLPPEMLRGWNGDPSNLRIELRPHVDGGVRVDPPRVHTPPAYTPPPPPPVRTHETRRVHSARPGRITGTIREHFFTLMNHRALLQQSDYRLAARSLLVPDGGLCATTSAVNVLHAAFSHLGRDTRVFSATSDALVHQLVGRAWSDLNKDARQGLDLPALGTVINRVANQLDPEVGVHAQTSYGWIKDGRVDTKEIGGDADTLSIIAVTTSATKAHAITVLGIDEYRQTITYSDPNYPNDPRERRYWIDRGQLHIEGFDGFGKVFDVLKVRTKTFDYSNSDRWGDFEGKRVWITARDGRKHLTTIHEVSKPSPEYPEGRVVQYSYLFGGGGGGTWTFDDIRAIEEAPPPSEKRIAELARFVGEKVRIHFADKGWERMHGSEVHVVEAVSREEKHEHHPYGGLEVRSVEPKRYSSNVVPFEAIESIEIVDDKLAARASQPATPSARRRNIV